jgi:hypothetical protein
VPESSIDDWCPYTADSFVALTSQATLSPKIPTSPSKVKNRIRAAWLDVRYSFHPLVVIVSQAPKIVLDTEGYSMTYPIVTAEEASISAKETVIEHDPVASLQALSDLLEPLLPTAVNSRAEIHFAPSFVDGTFHVSLLFGHWITDGLGGFKILNKVLESMNGLTKTYDWGSEVSRLSVPLGIATGHQKASGREVEPLP